MEAEDIRSQTSLAIPIPEQRRGLLLGLPALHAPPGRVPAGWKVPDVLIGGHHAEVAKMARPAGCGRGPDANRPDLLVILTNHRKTAHSKERQS